MDGFKWNLVGPEKIPELEETTAMAQILCLHETYGVGAVWNCSGMKTENHGIK